MRRKPGLRRRSSPGSHPLVPLSLREVGGQPQSGHEGQSLTDGQVREKTVILADVSDALLHQLGLVGPPVDQNLPGGHSAALVAARYDIQQRRFTATWRTLHINIHPETNPRLQAELVGQMWAPELPMRANIWPLRTRRVRLLMAFCLFPFTPHGILNSANLSYQGI